MCSNASFLITRTEEDDKEMHEAKCFKNARDHNKTLTQVMMIGHQLKKYASVFDVSAVELFRDPDKGIHLLLQFCSVTDVSRIIAI